jgi:hypothetical protein
MGDKSTFNQRELGVIGLVFTSMSASSPQQRLPPMRATKLEYCWRRGSHKSV